MAKYHHAYVRIIFFITAHYAAGSYSTASVLPKGLGIENIQYFIEGTGAARNPER